MGIVEQYLLQLKTEKRQWRRVTAILTVLSFLVAIAVSWNLRMTGITIANGATCGQIEHQHTGECNMEKTLICGYDDEIAADGEAPGHIHADECYEVACLCSLEEHIHTLSCYSDINADIESSVIWEADLPELTNDWAVDLVAVAQSQLGCSESERNYIVADDNKIRKGITRYGQWYGNPYGDWSGLFGMFCLNYANIPPEVVPRSPGVYNMMRMAQDLEIFFQPDSDMCHYGNLLFLDTDENGNADRLVVVTAYENTSITVIGGDLGNTVKEISLSDSDSGIMGYIALNRLQAALEPEKVSHPSESSESDPEKNTEGVLNPETVENIYAYELPYAGGTGILFHVFCGLPLISVPLVYGLRRRNKYGGSHKNKPPASGV